MAAPPDSQHDGPMDLEAFDDLVSGLPVVADLAADADGAVEDAVLAAWRLQSGA